MPTRTLTMRSIRELYRLKYEAGLSHERIARVLGEEHVASHPAQSTYKYSQFAQRYLDFVARLRRSMRQVYQ